MKKNWLPQRIGSWPQFMWWELDEILPTIAGIVMFILRGGWHWIAVGMAVSYGYIRIIKKGNVDFNLMDVFLGMGVFDLKGFPKGVSRRFRS